MGCEAGLAMSLAAGFHDLWPTPLGIHQFDDADQVNPVLARALGALRLAQCSARGVSFDAPFFASDDDLLRRLQLPEGQRLFKFFVESLRDTVTRANAQAWGPGRRAMQIAIEGMWFQCSRAGAFHDVHTHGNCSWSGVYIVQIDETSVREAHPTYGVGNGITRFIGPAFGRLGGAHIDLGNAYLQPPHCDVAPRPGILTVFPAWLAHQAIPYEGASDRIIISFNASIHASHGSDRLHAFGAT